MKKKHEHKIIEVVTEYFRDKPAEVQYARCVDCHHPFGNVAAMFQEREDRYWKIFGQTPFVFPEHSVSVGTRTLIDPNEPKYNENLN